LNARRINAASVSVLTMAARLLGEKETEEREQKREEARTNRIEATRQAFEQDLKTAMDQLNASYTSMVNLMHVGGSERVLADSLKLQVTAASTTTAAESVLSLIADLKLNRALQLQLQAEQGQGQEMSQ
jgi:hypothetical protein